MYIYITKMLECSNFHYISIIWLLCSSRFPPCRCAGFIRINRIVEYILSDRYLSKFYKFLLTIFRTPELRVRVMCPTRPRSPAIVQCARPRLMPLPRCDKAELIGDGSDCTLLCCIRSSHVQVRPGHRGRPPVAPTKADIGTTVVSGNSNGAGRWMIAEKDADMIEHDRSSPASVCDFSLSYFFFRSRSVTAMRYYCYYY